MEDIEKEKTEPETVSDRVGKILTRIYGGTAIRLWPGAVRVDFPEGSDPGSFVPCVSKKCGTGELVSVIPLYDETNAGKRIPGAVLVLETEGSPLRGPAPVNGAHGAEAKDVGING